MDHKLRDGDVDTYIATFNNLITQAGWTRSDAGTADLFQKGLPEGLKNAILNMENLPTNLGEWEEATRKQQNRYNVKKALLGPNWGRGRQKGQYWGGGGGLRQVLGLPHKPLNRPSPRHPDAMDVDATDVEANTGETQRRNRLQRERRCFKCEQQGHMARNCPRGQESSRIPRAGEGPRGTPGQQNRGNNPPRFTYNKRDPFSRYPPRTNIRTTDAETSGIPIIDDRSVIEDEHTPPYQEKGHPDTVAQQIRQMNMDKREKVWEAIQNDPDFC
jgi:Zinc knuckle